MPVFKIPIVHKFGIISHSQRIELQKHILEQAQGKDKNFLSRGHKVNPNPFQVTEEFVQKYNVAGLEEKEFLHNKAEQLLCRTKRRCGLLTAGEGDHVDLPLGWSELAILAQCNGKLQEDCLDALCISLNEAPLHEENIPTLFFLAESSLYWLHTDAIKQLYLRSTEIKLLNSQITERTDSVPALAASVYRSLVVWKAAVITKVGLKKSVLSLIEAVHELSNPEDWITGFMALSILGEAAKVKLEVCKVLQRIACGLELPDFSTNDHFNLPSVSPDAAMRSGKSSSDIQSISQSKIERKTSSLRGKTSRASGQRVTIHSEESNRPQSNVTMPALDSYQQRVNIPGIGGWRWENAFQYTLLLTDICLNGSSSEIQKTALMGKWGDADVTTFRAGVANPCFESSGLADLLEYRGLPPAKGETEKKDTEWTWIVRYGSVSGLHSIAHGLSGSKEKAGLRSAAWSLITAIQECAVTEERVLEALTISQNEISNSSNKRAVKSVWGRIAKQLSEVYLPTKLGPAPSSLAKTPPTSPRRQVTPGAKANLQPPVVKRPTLGQELLIHTAAVTHGPDFNFRTSMDLQRLVADQWRKEMIADQKKDEYKRLLEIEYEREEEEKTKAQMLMKRRDKLKGKPSAMLGPYELVQ